MCVPLSELLVDQSVGEPLTTDPDSLQHTIAPQLVENEVSVDDPWSFELVGDDATHKMRHCVAEGVHEVAQGLLVKLREARKYHKH